MLKCLGLLWSHCECETHTVNVKAVGLTVLAVSYWLCYSDVGLKSVPSTFRKGTHTVSKKKQKHGYFSRRVIAWHASIPSLSSSQKDMKLNE